MCCSVSWTGRRGQSSAGSGRRASLGKVTALLVLKLLYSWLPKNLKIVCIWSKLVCGRTCTIQFCTVCWVRKQAHWVYWFEHLFHESIVTSQFGDRFWLKLHWSSVTCRGHEEQGMHLSTDQNDTTGTKGSQQFYSCFFSWLFWEVFFGACFDHLQTFGCFSQPNVAEEAHPTFAEEAPKDATTLQVSYWRICQVEIALYAKAED